MTDREVMQQALEALEAKGDAWIVLERKAIISLRAALAETTQEPHDYRFRYDKSCYKCKSMYCPADCKDTAPPQRQWVGLTDEDLEFWTGELSQGELGRGVIRAVADKLKERNT